MKNKDVRKEFIATPDNYLLNYTCQAGHIAQLIDDDFVHGEGRFGTTILNYHDYKTTLYNFLLLKRKELKEEDLKFLLSKYSEVSGENILSMDEMQKDYERYVEICNTKTQGQFFGDLMVKYQVHNEGNEQAVVLIDGLPDKEERKEVLDAFYSMGYDVFYPQHPGTWSSKGEFTLKDIIGNYEGIIDDLSEKYSHVFLLGNSFGGTIVSGLKNLKQVEKVILFSPVFNLNLVPHIETLRDYLVHNCFPNMFRIKEQDWKVIINHFSKTNTGEIPANADILMVIGNKDYNTPLEDYLSLFRKDKTMVLDEGHIGLGRFNLRHFLITHSYFKGLRL